MRIIQRRSFLKALSGVPVIGAITKWYLFGDATVDKTSPAYAERLRGVSILRLLNTAQARHLHKFGGYTNLPDLAKDGSIEEVIAAPKAEASGYGRTFFSTLKLGERQVLPGWVLAHRVKNGAYTALLNGSATGGNSFATDQTGLILEGSPRSLASDGAWQSAREVIAGWPLGTNGAISKPSKVESLLKTFALGPETVDADANCCPDGCCCDNLLCNCHVFYLQGDFACGCDSCVWCGGDGCC